MLEPANLDWQAFVHPDAMRTPPTGADGWRCLIRRYRKLWLPVVSVPRPTETLAERSRVRPMRGPTREHTCSM